MSSCLFAGIFLLWHHCYNCHIVELRSLFFHFSTSNNKQIEKEDRDSSSHPNTTAVEHARTIARSVFASRFVASNGVQYVPRTYSCMLGGVDVRKREDICYGKSGARFGCLSWRARASVHKERGVFQPKCIVCLNRMNVTE